MKKIIISILILSLIFSPTAFAANYYVCDTDTCGQTPASPYDSWNNAADDMPIAMVRGTTYYIADGSYSGHTFNTACVGECDETDTTYILKATVAAHGTETGWDNAYGDGQARWGLNIQFTSKYWVFDGVTRDAADWSDSAKYGFYMQQSNCGAVTKMLGPNNIGNTSSPTGYIQISHIAFINCGSAYDVGQQAIYTNAYQATPNITVSRCYFTGGDTNMLFRNWQNSIIEYNWFNDNWSSAANHGQQIAPGGGSSNIILRNNVFKDSAAYIIGAHVTSCWGTTSGTVSSVTEGSVTVDGAGWTTDAHVNKQLYVSGAGTRYKVQSNTDDTLTVLPATVVTEGGAGGNSYQLASCGGPNADWKVYNNIVIGGSTTAGWGNADSGYVDVVTGWQVFNNTHDGVSFGSRGQVYVGRLTNITTKRSYAYNNLSFECADPKFTSDTAIIHDYQGFYSCTGTVPDETHDVTVASPGDPFTDSVADPPDLTLAAVGGAAVIDAGIAMDIEPPVDFTGTTGRPQDGGGGPLWDIGAYEWFTGGGEDYIVPTIDTISATRTTTYENNTVVTYTCSDNIGVTVERYRIGAAVTTPASGSAADSPQTITAEMSAGWNQVYIGCCDAAGNCGSDFVWVELIEATHAGGSF